MFQFPAYAPSYDGDGSSTRRVSPFGHLRINSCLQIPGAFRSLPRPSSLPEAKASSVRSCSLSRTFQVNNIATFTSQFLLVCLMKLQSHICNSKKLEFVIQTIISLTSFTSLSLSVLSMISQILSLKFPSSKGTAKVHTFFELANLFGIFFKKIPGRGRGFSIGAGDSGSSPE